MFSRRRFLRGTGIALGLPVFHSLTGSKFALGSTDIRPPVRTGFFYVPNGVNLYTWRVPNGGQLGDLPSTLAPLEPIRNQLTVISNLQADHCTGQDAGHEPAGGGFLVGKRCKHSEEPEVGGVSIDQIIAKQVGLATPVDSLTLGIDPGHTGDHGYSGTYLSHISWRGKRTPAPLELNPRLLFDRLYGGQSPRRNTPNDATSNESTSSDASVLDFVLEDARSLQRQLGHDDRQRLEDYIESVRSVEKRIQAASQSPHTHHEGSFDLDPELDGVYRTIEGLLPKDGRGIPESYIDHVNLMLDILALAYQADTTRVSSFMFSYEKSGRSYKEIGIRDAHHSISHHNEEAKNLDGLSQINALHTQLFARFLQRLQSIREGEGTLLDNCLFLYGSGISDGNKHNHDDLPILVAGGGGTAIQGNRHIVCEDKRPICDVYVSMAQAAGVKLDSFGDSVTPFAMS
jgi:hypothetical protein